MRAKEFIITESNGVFGRKPGDPYTHTDGTTAEFIDVAAFPPFDTASGELAGQYDSTESRDTAIADLEKQLGATVQWANPPANNLGFAIARVQNSDGAILLWGRYFKQVSPYMTSTWNNRQIPTGWTLQTKASKKQFLGLDPQTLIGTDKQFRGIDQVIAQVSSKSQNNEVLTSALRQTAEGKLAVFPGMIEQETGIRDYFGEIMGPVALMSGQISGMADDARKSLAGGANWSEMAIKWPMSMNTNLIDSEFMAPNGVKIGISSKGGKGAAASVKNLADAAKKADTENNKKLLSTARYAIDIVESIDRYDVISGPFEMGVKLGIASPNLRQEFNSYFKSGKKDFDGLSQEAINLVSSSNWKTNDPNFFTCWALLGGLANAVVNVVNSNPEFTNGALALLNTASIVQLYTNVGKTGNDITVRNYKAVYPPNFQGIIRLHNKYYFARKPSGKFTFLFD